MMILIAQGEADIKAGRVIPQAQVFKRIRRLIAKKARQRLLMRRLLARVEADLRAGLPQVVIPKRLLASLCLRDGDRLPAESTGDAIILRPIRKTSPIDIVGRIARDREARDWRVLGG